MAPLMGSGLDMFFVGARTHHWCGGVSDPGGVLGPRGWRREGRAAAAVGRPLGSTKRNEVGHAFRPASFRFVKVGLEPRWGSGATRLAARGTSGGWRGASPWLHQAERGRTRFSSGLPRAVQRATIVSMSIESLRAVRDHFSEVVDRVEFQHERVVVTRNGHAAAVLISPDDLAELEETLDVLSDPEALADIREADAAYARGDVVRGVDAVRQLRA